MRIVNTTARDITLNYRTGALVTVPANGYTERPDGDTDYLDDTAVTLALFSSGQLVLQATGGGAWGGAPLPGTPSQGKLPQLVEVLVDSTNQLKRSDDLTALGGGGGAGVTVVDGLTSTSSTSALSANQGRVLNDALASKADAAATATALASKADAAATATALASKADASALTNKAPRAGSGGVLAATYTTADADDAKVFAAPVATTVTVHLGAVQGFGLGVSGAGAVTFAGASGVTVTDKRATGSSAPTAALVYLAANTFEVWGTKA